MHTNALSFGQNRRTAPRRGGRPSHSPNRPATPWRRAIPALIAALLAWGCGSIPSSPLTGFEPYRPAADMADTEAARSPRAGAEAHVTPTGGPTQDSTGGHARIHVITFPEDDAEPVQSADTRRGDR